MKEFIINNVTFILQDRPSMKTVELFYLLETKRKTKKLRITQISIGNKNDEQIRSFVKSVANKKIAAHFKKIEAKKSKVDIVIDDIKLVDGKLV